MVKLTKQFSVCEEIIFHILERLPVKSLMRFKCVSKDWLSLIQNPYFVDCHTVCAHNRPGGIQLLAGNIFCQTGDDEFRSCSLSDPEGNLQSESVPLPTKFPLDPRRISNAEALICFDDYIWNPSTRETMILPPTKKHIFDCIATKHYLLGFDAFTNKYKVVCCWTCNFANQVRVILQVLTLGENYWKEIPFIPEEVGKGFEILASKSFSNMIFCLIKYGIKESLGVMTFDAQCEHVGFVPFPDDFKPLKNDLSIDLAEIEGRLAFQGIRQTLWVLNHEISKWTKIRITIDGCSDVESWYGFVFYGDEYIMAHLISIGTIHTKEILFQCNAEEKGLGERKRLKYFYYDPKTTQVRFVPKLDKFFDGRWQYMMIKHVDSLVSLKPPKASNKQP